MGIYADKDLYNWFTDEYPLYCSQKLDIGKSCIRFKKVNDIPFNLIGQIVQKMTPIQWIETYEEAFLKKNKQFILRSNSDRFVFQMLLFSNLV